MATKSVEKQVVIKDRRSAAAFVDALEQARDKDVRPAAEWNVAAFEVDSVQVREMFGQKGSAGLPRKK